MSHSHQESQRLNPSVVWLLVRAATIASFAGCGDAPTGPPPISSEQRLAIKQNLTQLGARVTADEPAELYLSLRNTHIKVLDVGGDIEGAARTRQDIQDFWRANEAVAKGFLNSGELDRFRQWLNQAMSRAAPPTSRGEYERYQLSLSKMPLRVMFSQRPSGE